MIDTAVILAAGMGTRLAGMAGDGPKGMSAWGGESLVERSIRLLQARGIRRVLIVVGYRKDVYERFCATRKGVEWVENPAYATSGTLTSLQCALPRIVSDFLLLESDLLFEARALDALLADPRPDLVLASGFTGAGDEVWIETAGGRLHAMSKDRQKLRSVDAEFVGICKISFPLARRLASLSGVAYETEGLVAAAQQHAIDVLTVPDLNWGELDDASHYKRIRTQVLPRIMEGEDG